MYDKQGSKAENEACATTMYGMLAVHLLVGTDLIICVTVAGQPIMSSRWAQSAPVQRLCVLRDKQRV